MPANLLLILLFLSLFFLKKARNPVFSRNKRVEEGRKERINRRSLHGSSTAQNPCIFKESWRKRGRKETAKMDFRQQFCNQPLIIRRYNISGSSPYWKNCFFSSFPLLSFPGIFRTPVFSRYQEKLEKKEEKREERKQKRRRNNNGQQSCLISTACKKCLIKKKTLNKEENSPSFQSLAFLSASVQQKL